MGDQAGLYLRISDDREGRELGVQRQDDDLTAAARDAGDTVVDRYRDNDISASTRSKKRRPAYERLIGDAKAGRINKIWAYTSNRLTRRPRENEDLIELAEKHGVRIAYLRSPSFDLNTSHGRQIARIMAANDAAESETIGERVQRKHLQIAEAGDYLGGARPFGWEDGGMVPVPAEFKVIRWMYQQLFAQRPLLAMARELNAEGVLTARGHQWRHDAVRKVLLRPRNAGLVEYQGRIIGPGKWPAPVDPEQWRAACALLANPARRVSPGGIRLYLGSGLYLCGVCADGTTVGTNKSSGGTVANRTKNRAYRCRRTPHLVRKAAPVDAHVEELAVARLSRPDAADLLHTGPGKQSVADAHDEVDRLKARVIELDDDYDAGRIDRDRWEARNERLVARIREVEAVLASSHITSPLTDLAGRSDLRKIWYGEKEDRSDGLSVDIRSAAVDALMTVTLTPARRGRQPGGGYFDFDSLHIDWKLG